MRTTKHPCISLLPLTALLCCIASLCFGNTDATMTDSKTAWRNLVGEKMANGPAFAYTKNDASLPNVLIYGDSVSMAYTPEVRRQLAGKANVYRIYCNGGDSASFIPKMKKMHQTMSAPELNAPWDFDWDVIHFNVGLHDLKYLHQGKLDSKNGKQVRSIDDYAKNLQKIISYLQKKHPEAKLIFATTTPVPKNAAGRMAGDALPYNDAAMGVMKDFPAIAINDLYTLTKPNHAAWQVAPGNVHYNKTGSSAQATAVVQQIRKIIYDKNNKESPSALGTRNLIQNL